MPHSVMIDDVHGEYLIPKESIVIANIWCVEDRASLDSAQSSTGPGPCCGTPVRTRTLRSSIRVLKFLPTDGSEPEYDPRQIRFGFGRRSVQLSSQCTSKLLTNAQHMSSSVYVRKHHSAEADLAELSLFLTAATVLSVFNISKPIVNGRVLELPVQTDENAAK